VALGVPRGRHGGQKEALEVRSSRPVVSCRTGRHRLGMSGLQKGGRPRRIEVALGGARGRLPCWLGACASGFPECGKGSVPRPDEVRDVVTRSGTTAERPVEETARAVLTN